MDRMIMRPPSALQIAALYAAGRNNALALARGCPKGSENRAACVKLAWRKHKSMMLMLSKIVAAWED